MFDAWKKFQRIILPNGVSDSEKKSPTKHIPVWEDVAPYYPIIFWETSSLFPLVEANSPPKR